MPRLAWGQPQLVPATRETTPRGKSGRRGLWHDEIKLNCTGKALNAPESNVPLEEPRDHRGTVHLPRGDAAKNRQLGAASDALSPARRAILSLCVSLFKNDHMARLKNLFPCYLQLPIQTRLPLTFAKRQHVPEQGTAGFTLS